MHRAPESPRSVLLCSVLVWDWWLARVQHLSGPAPIAAHKCNPGVACLHPSLHTRACLCTCSSQGGADAGCLVIMQSSTKTSDNVLLTCLWVF